MFWHFDHVWKKLLAGFWKSFWLPMPSYMNATGHVHQKTSQPKRLLTPLLPKIAIFISIIPFIRHALLIFFCIRCINWIITIYFTWIIPGMSLSDVLMDIASANSLWRRLPSSPLANWIELFPINGSTISNNAAGRSNKCLTCFIKSAFPMLMQ